MADDSTILAGIAGLIEARVGEASNVEVKNLRQIIGGNSSEIWSFDGRWTEDGVEHYKALILRRASATELVSGDRAAEFDLLKALERTPVPAPRVFWFDGDGRWLERPAMIMEKASGTAERELLSARNKQGLDLVARVGISTQIAEALARIHRVDVTTLALDRPASASNPALEQLEFYDAEILKTLVEPMPELRLASLWLREHLPEPPARATLVHGDYRPANVLVAEGRLSAVLDWEFAHTGDPAEDIGWYLTSYYAHEHLIEGSWSADDFTAVYEQALGAKADRKAIRFWAVFCLYKLASMTMAAQFAFVNGDNSRMGSSPDFILRPLLENTLRDMSGLTTGDLR